MLFLFHSYVVDQRHFVSGTENSCLSQAKKLKSQNETLASQINEVETECEKLMKQCQELPNTLIESRNEALSLSQNLEQMKSEVADLVHGMYATDACGTKWCSSF